jgi:hypothetical protein
LAPVASYPTSRPPRGPHLGERKAYAIPLRAATVFVAELALALSALGRVICDRGSLLLERVAATVYLASVRFIVLCLTMTPRPDECLSA